MPAAYLKAPEVLPSVQIPYWCMGKVRFDFPALAWQAAQRNRELRREHYLCRTCGGYHIGTQHGEAAPKASRAGLVR